MMKSVRILLWAIILNVLVIALFAQPPSNVSMNPSSGSGPTQTFAFTASSPAGYTNLAWMSIIFNSGLSGISGCYMQVYLQGGGTAYLANDAASNWVGSAALGSSSTMENSQCTLSLAGSSISASGNNLTVHLALTFKSAFLGAQNAYMYASDSSGQTSSWQNMGTWTVPGPTAPSGISISIPPPGSGNSGTFTATFTDPAGNADIEYMQIWFSADGTNSANSCMLLLVHSSGKFQVLNDAGNAWQAPITPGQSDQNSQCILNTGSSGFTYSGNTATMTVNLTFKTAFSGPKGVWLWAENFGGEAAWGGQIASWTVPGAGPPSGISISPPSGNGSAQTFTANFTDPVAAANIQYLEMTITANNSTSANNCSVLYSHSTQQFALSDDSGTWRTGFAPGGSDTNSQCTLTSSSPGTSFSGAAASMTFTTTFKPAFVGAKQSYLWTENYAGQSAGTGQLGSWTVTSPTPVTAPTFSPTGGTYTSPQVVTISTTTLGASIRYTTDTTTPSETNGIAYSGPVTIGSSSTLKAIAYESGMTDSSVTSAGYTIATTASSTITTSPSGLSIVVDGSTYPAPQTFQWIAGSAHTIAITTTPQSGSSGVQYTYSSWNIGSAPTQNIAAPSSTTTYTASFATQYQLTTSASAGGSISPASGWINSGQTATVISTSAAGYQFTGFTGATGASLGTASPQNFLMTTPLSVTANFKASPPPSLSITTASLPNGTARLYYSQQLTAVGGSPNYTWSVLSGALPIGVTLSSGGLISGFPADQGAFSYPIQVTIKVADSLNHVSQQIFNFSINFGSLMITNVFPLPSATVGQHYSFTFASVGGGFSGNSWGVQTPGLPPGLNLNATTGELNGTPTQASAANQPYFLTIQLTSGITNPTVIQGFELAILPSLATNPTVSCSASSSSITVGQSVTLTALPGSGGNQPFNFNWSAFGTTFAGSQFSFSPSTMGLYNVLVGITDSNGRSSSGACSVSVGPSPTSPLTITTGTTLPPATSGIPYSVSLTATGGSQAYSWSLSSGSLPPGLSLSAAGLLSGVPTTTSFYTFVATVNNAISQTFGVVVSAQTGLSVSCSATTHILRMGQPVMFSAYASGGASNYSYAWSGAVVFGNSQSVTFQPSVTGIVTESLAVTDARGGTGLAKCSAYYLPVGGGEGDGYDCTLQAVSDQAFYILSDGTVVANFQAEVDPAGTPNWTDWGTRIFQAQLTTPRASFGPVDGALGDPVHFLSTFSQTGFGQYTWGAGNFEYTNSNCSDIPGGSPVDVGPDAESLTIQPMLTGLSPNTGVVGTVVNVTATGSGLSGISDVAISPSNGIQAAVTSVDDDNTVQLSFDLTGSSVKPQNYNVALLLLGAATPSQAFTVGDTPPVIDTIDQNPPQLYPGGTGSIIISGSNFGDSCPGGLPCSGAGITITSNNTGTSCSSGIPSCTPSDVTSTITSWSPIQIVATVNAGSTASGFYDVVVTSAGAFGNGYLPVPGTPPATSNPKKISVGVQGQPNLGLQLIGPDSQGNLRVMSSGDCAYIDPAPQMPSMTASIMSLDGSAVTGNATWQMVTTFPYFTRIGSSQTAVPAPPASQTTPTTRAQQAANQAWVPLFSSILGGGTDLLWTYNGAAQPVLEFKICGRNPAFSDIDDAMNVASINETTYWFQRNIAIHETDESQFCDVASRTGGAPYCNKSANSGSPILGAPAGYGLTQLDPTPSVDAIWNWQSNIAQGQVRIGGDGIGGGHDGYSFWERQVTQWKQFNDAQTDPNKKVKMAVDPPTNDPTTYRNPPSLYDLLKSPNCTFTMSLEGDGATTVNTGQANPAWLGDAILMEQQGGAPHNYISWDNQPPNNLTPRWSFNKGNSVSKNIVYEFCTCTAPGRNTGCKQDLKCGGTFDGVTLPTLATCKP
jgi:hypothetical protein